MLNIWFSACIILSWLIMFRLHEQFSACTISLQHSAEFQAQLHKINWIEKHISFIFIPNTQVHYTEGTIAIANTSFWRDITHSKSSLCSELHTEALTIQNLWKYSLHSEAELPASQLQPTRDWAPCTPPAGFPSILSFSARCRLG